MNKFNKTYLVLGGLGLLLQSNSWGGGASDGGAFAFRNPSALLKNVASTSFTEEYANRVDNECFNRELKKVGLKPIPIKKMYQIIRNYRENINGEETRKTPEGRMEPLLMNYGIDPETGEGYIEALKLFYIGYIAVKDFSSVWSDVQDLLVHEASHLFDYDELEARKLLAQGTDQGDFWFKISKCSIYR